MQAFEAIMATLLKREGYWVRPEYKVALTKEEKVRIGRPSSPRWEIDLVAYKGADNHVLAVECKSYLDSTGVIFRDGRLESESRYKLFREPVLRETVLSHLGRQLVEEGACAPSPKVTLCLAAGKIASSSDRDGMAREFERQGWLLFDPEWICERLREAAGQPYENDVAFVMAKLLLRNRE